MSGASVDVASRVARERAAQGLPPKITDPVALAKVAGLLETARDVPDRGAQNGGTDASAS